MANNKVSMNDAIDKIISDGTTATLKKILNELSKKNHESKKTVQNFNAKQMDEILEANEINEVCPHCGMIKSTFGKNNIVKNGKYSNGMQRFHCNGCGKNFNRLTNTFLAQTTFSFDYWVELVWLEINWIALTNAQQNLIVDDMIPYVSQPTLWSQRMKLMAATHKLQPNLSGIVQIDECHIHEAQKGENNLINYLDGKQKRLPRYCYKPAKYGVKGAEFVTIVCAVDNSKNYFSYVSGFGALQEDVFHDFVIPHIRDAIWLCSDANVTYTTYSKRFGLPHYVKPSNYKNAIKDCKTDADVESYYKKQLLDYVLNYNNNITYKQFQKLKKDNHLSIAYVDSFHNEIKSYICSKRGINIEYVQYYMDWLTYLKNIHKVLGTKPTTKEHARYILIDLLKKSTDFLTTKNLTETDINLLPTPSQRYTSILVKETDNVRAITGDNKFVLSHEDVGDSLSIRKQIDSIQSVTVLKELGKALKIKNYSRAKKGHTYFLRKALEVHPDIREALAEIRVKHKTKGLSIKVCKLF